MKNWYYYNLVYFTTLSFCRKKGKVKKKKCPSEMFPISRWLVQSWHQKVKTFYNSFNHFWRRFRIVVSQFQVKIGESKRGVFPGRKFYGSGKIFFVDSLVYWLTLKNIFKKMTKMFKTFNVFGANGYFLKHNIMLFVVESY